MNIAYFQHLNQTLRTYKRAIPSLIVDLDKLDQNIAILHASIPKAKAFRIVVKSLPSIPLIDYVMEKMGTHKLMVFHQPFLTQLAHHYGKRVHILMGKPMPIQTATYFYQTLDPACAFQASQQLQWLIDTEKRLHQYIALAKQLNQKLLLNLEIDVGLHRGGFGHLGQLEAILHMFERNTPYIEFAGFMGYDPHVAILPKVLRSQKKSFRLANGFYESCIGLVQHSFPRLWKETLTFNGAGSPTLGVHQDPGSVLNDISAGSALVKPTHFDLPSLSGYVPACFIASPVLKKCAGTSLPALEKLGGIMGLFNPSFKKSYFIYGGYWKADFYYPPKTSVNTIFGPSTNQSMVHTASPIELEVDDFVFLRPTQSEFVFLQFGDILAMRGGQIITEWPVLKNG